MTASETNASGDERMLYPARHRTGRERIVFGDPPSRKQGRNFLRRLVGARGKIAEFNRHGITFEDLWRLDLATALDPREVRYLLWLSRRDDFQASIRAFREAAKRLRELKGLNIPAGLPGGPRAFDLTGLAEKLAGINRHLPEGSVVAGVLAPPWPPSVGKRMPQIADDLEEIAERLDRIEPGLPWRLPGAPFNAQEHGFWEDWEELARSRTDGPLHRLGTIVFKAVFGRLVEVKSVKRSSEKRRQKESRPT